MDKVNQWKYNGNKHCVFKYNHPDALREEIPVQGKVDWKDGEDVTGKFKIVKSRLQFADDRQHDIAIPINIQEQPRGFTYPTQGIKPITPFKNQSQEGFTKKGEEKELFEWVKASEELPDKVGTYFAIDSGRKKIYTLGDVRTVATFSKLEWLRPVTKASLKPIEVVKQGNVSDAVEFAQFLLNDYEIIDDIGWDGEMHLYWQLAGTNQKYTTEEIYNEFKALPAPPKSIKK